MYYIYARIQLYMHIFFESLDIFTSKHHMYIHMTNNAIICDLKSMYVLTNVLYGLKNSSLTDKIKSIPLLFLDAQK